MPAAERDRMALVQPSAHRIALLAPMVSELKPLLKQARLHDDTIGDVRVAVGSAGTNEIVATKIGIGTERASRATERLLDASSFDRVIVVGIAGGVGSIPIAELIYPEAVIDGVTGRAYEPAALPGVVPHGELETSDEIHVDAEKIRAFEARGVIALDMETASVAAVCEQRGVAWSVVRSISDIAGESPLDDSIMQMAGPDGSPQIGPVIRYLATKPWRIPKLAELARDSTTAANAAAGAALRLCALL
jgi:adenosylhomocysteine nucleosidase